jgi:hypothetical protein
MKYLSSSAGMYGVYCARNTIRSAQKSVVKRRVKMYRPNRDNAGQCHSLSFGTMPSGGLLAREVLTTHTTKISIAGLHFFVDPFPTNGNI